MHAKRNHVHMITLAPHTSNKTQPLDRTVFGPVKKFYNDAAVSWMMKNPGQTISIYNVAELVKEAWLRGATPVNIISGFRASGIWPFNRNTFPDEYFAPAEVTNRPEPANEINLPGPSGQRRPTISSCSAPSHEDDDAAAGGSSVIEDIAEVGHGGANAVTDEAAETRHIPAVATPDQPVWQSGSIFISPQQFKGFPKAPPRTENGRGRGRKRGTCMLATSSPHLEKKRSEKMPKDNPKIKLASKVLFQDDSDDDIELEDILNSDNEEEGNAFVLGEVSSVQVGEFVVCEYGGQKSSLFYVGIVTKEVDDEGDVEVDFLRKSDKVQGKVVKPNIEEIVSVPLSQVKGKVTRAQTSGTTMRTKHAYFFNEDLSELNLH